MQRTILQTISLEAPKSPNNAASTFFNAVHLLAKDLRFEHGSTKLVSCPERHLTSVRPWSKLSVLLKKKFSLCLGLCCFVCYFFEGVLINTKNVY